MSADDSASAVLRIRDRESFARELAHARERAGKTVRELAAATKIPTSTLSGYFSGRHLPLPGPGGLVRVLAGCGIEDPSLVQHWQNALLHVRTLPRSARPTGVVPYRGLAPYEREDSEWFFGRDSLASSVIEEVDKISESGGVVAVVGPSGAGKSSLLRAGVAARLEEQWSVMVSTPAEGVVALPTAQAGQHGVLVVVDQFEELFSLVDDHAARVDYLNWITADHAEVVFVLGMRADAVAHALRYPALVEVLRRSQVLVGPMSTDELKNVITCPAALAGIPLEDELVELILRDIAPRSSVGGEAGHEIGSLPLLSHVLHELVHENPGGGLTVAAYLKIGGLAHAVHTTAESVFQSLSATQREIARNLLLRLVQVSDHGRDTRRQVEYSEITAIDRVEFDECDHVLDKFAVHRLVTIDNTTVEIAHDTLLIAWGRLRRWLDESRQALLIQRKLTVDAEAWEAVGRDPGATYRGALLATARSVRDRHTSGIALSKLEQEFLATSEAAEAAELSRRRRSFQRVQRLAAALVVLLLVTVVSGALALVQAKEARTQRDLAVSRLLAMRAEILQGTDPAVAAQLAVAAYRTSPTVEARSALLGAARMANPARLTGPSGFTQALAASSDDRTLAAAGTDGIVRLWTRAAGTAAWELTAQLSGADGEIYALALHSGAGQVLAAGQGNRVYRWEIRDPVQPRRLPDLTGPTSSIKTLAVTSTGTVVAGSADHHVYRWATAPTPIGALDLGVPVEALAISPDDLMVVAGGEGGTAKLWPISDLTRPGAPGLNLAAHTGTVRAAAFSPDGRTLALGGGDKSVSLWNLNAPEGPSAPAAKLTGNVSWVNAIAFTADGSTLVTGGSDNTVRTFDVRSGVPGVVLPHPAPVTAVHFLDDGATLATGGGDGTVRTWPLPGPVFAGIGDTVFSLTFSADGRLAAAGGGAADNKVHLIDAQVLTAPRRVGEPITATGSTSALSGASALSPDGLTLIAGHVDGAVHAWSLVDPAHPLPLPSPTPPTGATVQTIAFNPDGTVVAVGGDDQKVRLFTNPSQGLTAPVATLTGPTAPVFGLSFNRDGTILAVASADKTFTLWDIHDPQRPRQLSKVIAHTNYIYAVAFNPTADLLVTASADRTLRFWNTTDPATPTALGTPLTGPTGPIIAAAISPDGRSLAAVGKDRRTWIWSLAEPGSPELVASPAGPASDLYAVTFTPDSAAVALAGTDRMVSSIRLDAETTITSLCKATGEPLTREEWANLAPGVEPIQGCRQ